MPTARRQIERRVRACLAVVISGLVLSGLTALPLTSEARVLDGWAGPGTPLGERWPDLARWLHALHVGLADNDVRYPFIAYGTDWLAFAHLVIALAFVGPWRDPVRNAWVVDFGLLACVLVVPFAFAAGGLRGIPWFWRGLDALFGVCGAVPLLLAQRWIRELGRSDS